MKNHFDNRYATRRYSLIAVFFILLAVGVLARAGYTMTAKRQYWLDVQKKVKRDSMTIAPIRGSVYGDNGQQLACNLPEYHIYLDFQAMRDSKCDTLLYDRHGNPTKEFHALCKGLHEIFPSRSAHDFMDDIDRGYRWVSEKGTYNRHWALWKHRIDYMTFQQVKKLPILRLGPNRAGFGHEEKMVRNHPYGDLAYSVIGDTYKESNKAFSGLELKFDSLMSGKPGFKRRRKVLNRYISISDSAATDGYDIATTIDVNMQDLAERALKKELIKDNAYTGVAVVMDVKTGDVKAMVNLDRQEDGSYKEGRNHAVADMLEPGSVFKTASIMVALEDGYIPDTARCWVDTGCGRIQMGGKWMRDHNWNRGGYGSINVCRILQVSSNIGVSAIINRHYSNCPDKFVEGIHRLGLATDLDLPFNEYHKPRIRIPKRDSKGKFTLNWSATALPWMSIGYETQVPPISTLTLYNAIANNGRMVKPRFVTHIEKDGEIVKEFPVEVIKEHIASERTVSIMQDMLYKVVHFGLGKAAGVQGIKVAGKTGTAQKPHNGRYALGADYLLSFCGYFPADDPQYSCIVCIQKTGLPASGGTMSGQVFHDIAEGILANRIKYDVRSAHDELSEKVPSVKQGNILAADYVLSHLNVPSHNPWNESYVKSKTIWGTAVKSTNSVSLHKVAVMPKGFMPDVIGMGARDAVYMLESRGLRVSLQGRGKVVRQSIEAKAHVKKGQHVMLTLK